MEKQVENIIVKEPHDNLRIDKYIKEIKPDISRGYIQKLIKENNILVNNKIVKQSYQLQTEDCVSIFIPELEELSIKPEKIELDILYEDEDIIVINKEKGMVVHPAAGHYTGTLVNALLYHCRDNLSGINGVLRPGIVHRIDRDTTGSIVICKNDAAHREIARQLKDHTITRKYYAICYNILKEESGTIHAPIGRHPVERKKMAIVPNGKEAITHYRLLENLKGKYAYIECQLETGRTHQIRVHMASIHHPLIGDIVYGNLKDSFAIEGQALHAKTLGFIHPRTKEYMEFEAPFPSYFIELLKKLQ